MSNPSGSNNKRWWLWWPLLATLAWLVVQEQSPSTDGAAASLPTRPHSTRSPPTMPLLPPPTNYALLALAPRDQLFATSSPQTRPAPRDLFAVRIAPAPPSNPIAMETVPPSAPALPFRYVGKQWDGRAWEVYAVSGGQTYVLREGMVLDDQYRVDRIEPPQASLTYLPLGTVQNLPIGDSR